MLARNAALNFGGHVLPLVAALLLVPALLARLEVERFGFLALAWALVGYFSLFDLGIGRALCRLVSERTGTPHEAGLPALSNSALSLTLALGIVAGAMLAAAAGPLCESALNLSPELRAEGTSALRILALSLPLVTVTAALRGLLEARHRFDWVNAIRAPLGILTFAAPLAATIWSTGLIAMVTALVAVRIAAFLAHWGACARLCPLLLGFGGLRAAAIREMLSFGAWLTVSNLVGPLMVYVDRFVIAALIAVSWVAYYVAPYEVVTRLWLIPAAVTGVLFPAMAGASAERLAQLYGTGIKAVLIGVVPLSLLATLFAAEWLRAWLGADFAAHGTRVAQLLCIGAAVNCLAYLPLTLLHARGRADLSAKMHLAELPVYLGLLWILIDAWGIQGAALAWLLRCTADCAALFVLAYRCFGPASRVFSAPQIATIGFALAGLAGACAPFSPVQKAFYSIVTLGAFSLLVWLVLLNDAERVRVRRPLALLSGNPPQ
jgi:O-antigen/teichoic acid export membrane protein